MYNMLRDTGNKRNKTRPANPPVPSPPWLIPLPQQHRTSELQSTIAAPHEAAGTLGPENEELNEANALNTENRYVIQLLNKHNNATALEHTIPLTSLIKNVIGFLEGDGESHTRLARQLQKAKGHYGGNLGEVLSSATQKSIIRDWLCRNLLGDRLDTIIEKEILKAPLSIHFSNAGLNQFISRTALPPEFENSHFKPWIWTHVMMGEMPGMRYFLIVQRPEDPDFKRFETMKLNDFEWGQIHAGLLLAQSAGLDLDMSIAEAADLGKMLLAQLKQGGVPNLWWQFYRLPALIRYAQTYPDLLRNTEDGIKAEMEAHAMLTYAESHDDFLNKNCAVASFQSLIQNYQTRRQLAQKQIDEKCPGMKLDTYLNKASKFCFRQATNNVFSRLDRLGAPDKKYIQSTMPDINQLYQTQIDGISRAYEVLDKLLLLAAWSKLVQADIDFIAVARIDRAQARFSAAYTINKVPFIGRNTHAREGLMAHFANVEFFMAERANQPLRIYALKKTDQGYDVRRVDKDEQLYYDFLSEDKRPIDDPSFKLQVHHVGPALKLQEQELEQVFDRIAKKHQHDFAQQLYDYGYEKTSLEQFQAFMLSLVPFYTCVSSVQKHAVVQAELSCGIELMTLVPVAGELSIMSEKLAQTVARGGLIAARRATTEMALNTSLKTAIKNGSAEFVRHALLPASQMLEKKELNALSLATMRALDPGIELSCVIGRASLKQMVQLGQGLTLSLPRLKSILPQLRAALEKIPPPLPSEACRLAHLPGIDREIQVVKLGGDQFNGADVYARLHKKTGEPFGCKYVLSPQGKLTAIPRKQARHLHNLLTQGLGGKGAPEQGMKWARDGEIAGSSSVTTAIDKSRNRIPADQDVQTTFLNDFSTLVTKDDNFGNYFKYNIDLDVFIPQEASHVSDLCILAPQTRQLQSISISAADSRAQTISLDHRTAVIKALGIDLDLASLSVAGPRPDVARTAIPQMLSFVWVGPKPIPDGILETVRVNVKKAHAQGYTVVFYLSSQSKEKNFNKLKNAVSSDARWYARKKLEIAILEETDFYQGFKVSYSFQQYEDAIHGNHGIATNYASAADILRFALLKDKGGIYMDVDDHLTTEFGTIQLMAGKNEFVLGAPITAETLGMHHQYGTSMFGSHPGNMAIEDVLQEMHRRYLQQEYKDFYKIPRPAAADWDGMRTYRNTLFHLTGPDVFNVILYRNFPDLKAFTEMIKLKQICNQPGTSKLLGELSKHLASADQMTPLANAHVPGNLHSWRDARR